MKTWKCANCGKLVRGEFDPLLRRYLPVSNYWKYASPNLHIITEVYCGAQCSLLKYEKDNEKRVSSSRNAR